MEICPHCSGLMLSRVVDYKGYARPLSDGDKRRSRASQAPSPAWRCEAQEQVGKLVIVYDCEDCKATVVPGVTHIRHWFLCDQWITAGRRLAGFLWQDTEALREYRRNLRNQNPERYRAQTRERVQKWRLKKNEQ